MLDERMEAAKKSNMAEATSMQPEDMMMVWGRSALVAY
jgi:hypothetical protein